MLVAAVIVLTFVSVPNLGSALAVTLSVGVQERGRRLTYFELFQPLLEHLHDLARKHLVTAILQAKFVQYFCTGHVTAHFLTFAAIPGQYTKPSIFSSFARSVIQMAAANTQLSLYIAYSVCLQQHHANINVSIDNLFYFLQSLD